MNSFLWILVIFLFLVAAWFAWRYYDLTKRIDRYINEIRKQDKNLPSDIKGIENLSNAIASLKTAFNFQLSTLNSENARLSTVLEQLTDGVIIVDANGLIQFANPAAQKLFEISDAPGHSVTEVVRNHQLVDAWRRCQQTNEMQSESFARAGSDPRAQA
jgi:PAS domain-containing protein